MAIMLSVTYMGKSHASLIPAKINTVVELMSASKIRVQVRPLNPYISKLTIRNCWAVFIKHCHGRILISAAIDFQTATADYYGISIGYICQVLSS